VGGGGSYGLCLTTEGNRAYFLLPPVRFTQSPLQSKAVLLASGILSAETFEIRVFAVTLRWQC